MRVIVVGGGEVGTHLAERLSLQGWDLVLIEVNPAVRAKAEGLLDVLTLQGEGTNPEVLERAGVKETDIFISVTSSDEVNIVACQLARLYGVKECIARVNNESLRRGDLHLAEHLGINMFIAPNMSVAEEVVRIVANPSATGVADFFDGELRLLAFELGNDAYAAGRNLKELRRTFHPRDFILAAVLRKGKILVPEGETVLEEGDRLHLLGAPSDIHFIAEKFGARKVTGHNVVVVGGGRVGAEVARQISDFGFTVKIIEKNPERCKELSGRLPGVLVLEGDGIDSKLMGEENLGKADIFVCVTSDEAANLLSATIGKQMGAGKAIALIKRGDMFAPAYALNVDVAINARLAVADRILRHLQRDRILSMFTFPGEDLEALEFVVKDRKEVTGVPIKELSLPGGVLIGAISRSEEVILPSGATKLQAGDRVILFARYADHKQMEALFLN